MPIVLQQTKHFQTTLQLRQVVGELPSGECLPTASQLAADLGASHGTVIRALNALTREGMIHRPFGKKRYIVSANAPRAAARIAMLRPDYPSFDLDAMANSVYAAGKAKNWVFRQHCFGGYDQVDFSRLLEDSDAAVLINNCDPLTNAFLRAIADSRAPVVVMIQHVGHPGIDNVVMDDFRIGELAAETFHELEHRRIVVLHDQAMETTLAERIRGFRSAAARYGLRDYEVLGASIQAGESAMDKTYHYLNELMRRKSLKGHAVFCLTLAGALALLRAAREHGLRVPEDVGILSYGGESQTLGAYLTPPLTCIEVEMEELGRSAVALIEQALSPEGRTRGSKRVLKPHLVMRESLLPAAQMTC